MSDDGLISIDEVFTRVEKMILLADGDRDHGNPSALTCNQSMVSLHLLRELKIRHDAMAKALAEIAAMDPKGVRADDLGRAARIAAGAVSDRVAEGKQP
jgi:hypothetical protein